MELLTKAALWFFTQTPHQQRITLEMIHDASGLFGLSTERALVVVFNMINAANEAENA